MRELPALPVLERRSVLTLPTEPDIAARLATIRGQIAEAARAAGREPAEITLVGASKRQPTAHLEAAWNAGLRDFGENRVQEAEAKQDALPKGARWHLIGPLQSNKARRAAAIFDVVESVDRDSIAVALDRFAREMDKRLACFVQVNLGNEPNKHGYGPEELLAGLGRLASLDRLDIRGLMAIPPRSTDEAEARSWFKLLFELRDQGIEAGLLPPNAELSMGMSADFQLAIEEGATCVRVGTALFGERH